jgi:hypothetical protein
MAFMVGHLESFAGIASTHRVHPRSSDMQGPANRAVRGSYKWLAARQFALATEMPKSGNRFSDHAQTKSQSGMMIRRKLIPL